MRAWLLSLGTILLGAVLAWAAGPMPDSFAVHFADPVVVSNSLTLQPGNYRFKRITRPTDPAVFTIMNADSGKVIGNTPTAILNPNGPGPSSAGSVNTVEKGYLLIDQYDGKSYLDTVYLQGMGHGFMFNQPSEARSQGHQVRVPIDTGGQD